MVAEQARPTNGASVVMEIGGAIGAVVVHMPGGMEGDEIEVWPADGTGPLTHALVRRRHVGQRCRFAAVFPALEAGDYILRSVRDRAATPRKVTVLGGQVASADW
jgi:hypothetical protein